MAWALFAGSLTRQDESFRFIADTIKHLNATQVDVLFRIQPADPSAPSRLWPNHTLAASYLAKMTTTNLNLKLVGQGVAEVCIPCRRIDTIDPKRPKKYVLIPHTEPAHTYMHACMYACMHV